MWGPPTRRVTDRPTIRLEVACETPSLLEEAVGEVREEDERARKGQEDQVEPPVADPETPNRPGGQPRRPGKTSNPPTRKSRESYQPTPGRGTPGRRTDVKIISPCCASDPPNRPSPGARPDGGHHGPRLPPDAPPDRRRRPRDDGVHLVGGDHPGQRAAAPQDGLLRRGASALDPDLRLGSGAHGRRGRHRRGARAGRLRHQHGLPGQQGAQGLRGRGADGRPPARAPDRPRRSRAASRSR